jgi:hypothetical protein
MKNIFSYLVLISLIISCNKTKTGSLIVNGQIEGLKKGTVYLQKFKDTLLVSVDSIQLNGNSNFTLVDDIESPEIYYISMDKTGDNRISFFGEKGEISISSKLSKFAISAKITGSSNQVLLEDYSKMIQQFNGKQLDLIKEKFEAQKNKDLELYSKLEKEEKNLIKRKYFYTINFAVNNADVEIAPYLALTELYNTNIKYLDTINNSLSKNVKSSKYGVQLEEFIQKIKKTEK